MGFEVPSRTAVLEFEGGKYDGAEVRCELDVPLEVYFSIAKLAESRKPEQVREAIRMFGDEVLISWNLTRRGREIPPDGDGMLRLGHEMARDVMAAWLDAVGTVEDPLGSPSHDGATSAAGQTQTGTRSSSRKR